AEIDSIVSHSKIAAKYNQVIDSESAYEILNGKLNEAAKRTEEQKQQDVEEKTERKTTKKDKGFFDDPMVKQAGRTATSIITRTLLGVLGLGGTTRRRRGGLF